MRNRIVASLVICLSLAMPLASAFAQFASPSEPHGLVTTLFDRPGQELYGVRITEVDGKLVGGAREKAVWLEPGEHTIQARGAVVDRGFRGGTTRTHEQLREPGLDSVTINVEEGKTYFLALDGSAPDPKDWKIVVYKEE
ncbi:MAG: hypothetical protein RQ741_00335 [Wenzhouxiangellaceae bacterium]|nr:hypothetical protein [Wenzhouxiangellaceae bacterium]